MGDCPALLSCFAVVAAAGGAAKVVVDVQRVYFGVLFGVLFAVVVCRLYHTNSFWGWGMKVGSDGVVGGAP